MKNLNLFTLLATFLFITFASSHPAFAQTCYYMSLGCSGQNTSSQSSTNPYSGQSYTNPYSSQGYADPYSGQSYINPYSGQSYTNPYSGQSYTDPYSSQGYADPYSSQGYTNPYSGQSYTNPYSSQSYTNPYSSQSYTDPYSSQGYTDPYSSLGYTNPYSGQSYTNYSLPQQREASSRSYTNYSLSQQREASSRSYTNSYSSQGYNSYDMISYQAELEGNAREFEYRVEQQSRAIELLQGQLQNPCGRGLGVWELPPEECAERKLAIYEELEKEREMLEYYSGRANEIQSYTNYSLSQQREASSRSYTNSYSSQGYNSYDMISYQAELEGNAREFEYRVEQQSRAIELLQGQLQNPCGRGLGVWELPPEECAERKLAIYEELEKEREMLEYYSGRANEIYEMMRELGGESHSSTNY